MKTARRSGFTLVELLVVITIITVLAGLITVAAMGALKKSQQTRIKAEINHIADGFEQYHNRVKAYPPNCQSAASVDLNALWKHFNQHLKKAFPRHQEVDELLFMIIGAWPEDRDYTPPLDRGISAGEAIVFWMGGFSDDPKYPISGDGGPSYLASLGNQDPIEKRIWTYPCDVSRLVPRNSDGYFDDSGRRYIEYPDPRFPKDRSKRRRINFWQYLPQNSQQPYLYFDVSRADPTLTTDTPLLTRGITQPCVYAFKRIAGTNANGDPIFKFANDGKFQILHCGSDDAWGDAITQLHTYAYVKSFPGPEYQNLLRLDIDADGTITSAEKKAVLAFPDGPFTGDLADTVVNFATQTRIYDAAAQ